MVEIGDFSKTVILIILDSGAVISYHDDSAYDSWGMSAGRGVSEAETVIATTGKLGRRSQITLRSDACTFLKGAVTRSWKADFEDSDCAISLPS